MKLLEFSEKLKKTTQGYPSVINVLGRIDDQYLYLDKFCSYAYANRLAGYFTLSKEPVIKTLFALSYEIRQQCFLYQYYENGLSLISPQFTELGRKDLPKIKLLELEYNKKYNAIILF